MLELAQLVPGARVQGIVPDGPVTIVGLKPYGKSAIKVFFEVESSGVPGSRILYDADAQSLDLVSEVRGWAFDGDGRLFRLVLEAERLRLAYLFDSQLAVSISRVEPLPHQLAAVYDEMLPRQPLRFLLADDPGAGKTIMTGLLIKELLLRADIERCLIVVPAALDVQWQDELRDKFGLHFALLGREQIIGALGNAFEDHDLAIGRIDLLKQDDYVERLHGPHWDLVIFDEAHKLGSTYLPGPNEIKATARYRLAKVLGERTRHLLLLTATPHRGKHADFELLLGLLDSDRFAGRPREQAPTGADVDEYRDLMRRMLKEDIVDFDGQPLFPERFAFTVAYTLSKQEVDLYEAVTRYVREEMTRADEIANRGGGEGKRRRAVVGFALTMLQRRLASSPEAILRSLERRRARLATSLEKERQREENIDAPGSGRAGSTKSTQLGLDIDLGVSVKGVKLDLDEFETDLDERPEGEADAIVDRASAAQSLVDLEREVALLQHLADQARQLREANVDAKWLQLSELLDDPRMFDEQGRRLKLVIFSEHRDTLEYLRERVCKKLGGEDEIAVIHGALAREERHREQTRFVGDDPDLPEANVLIATDAAGEGINLQVAHLMVNYDLPWNPNRLEQRFGRIHRFGQQHACYNWNLVARNTREGDVYKTLLDKLNEARDALGGKVFDVLGQLFADRPLRDLLIEAIRQDDAETSSRVERDIESLVSLERYREIVKRQALARIEFTPEELQSVRTERSRSEMNRLVPHVIGGFFVEAFREVGGTIEEQESGRYKIPVVPHEVRRRGRGYTPIITDRYERVCFDKERVRIGHPRDGNAPQQSTRFSRVPKEAELVTPGHTIFNVTIELLQERHGAILHRGALLLDPRPGSEAPRVLVCIAGEIADERADASGKRRLASSELRFVEVNADGHVHDVGTAPHLDYRPLDEEESALVAPLQEAAWVDDATEVAEIYAVEHLLPQHLVRVRREREDGIFKARAAIDTRLTAELYRLDEEITHLRKQEAAGRQPKMNVDNKRRQYQALEERRQRRLQELDQQLRLTLQPPRIVAVALIVPEALLATLRGEPDAADHARATRRIEELAMREATRRERAAGYLVRDVSNDNRGYDLESEDPHTGALRLIEVKGRDTRGESITLTRNEYLCALNNRADFILAIVQIEGEAIRAYHAIPDPLGRTTEEGLPFGQEATMFSISGLIRGLGSP